MSDSYNIVSVDDQQKLTEVWDTFRYLLESWRDRREASAKNYAFVEGGKGQWDTAIYDGLVNRGIMPLSINMLLPRVLRILGYQDEIKGRLIAKPTVNSSVDDAEVATRLLDWSNFDENRDMALAEAFGHMIIGEMGGFIEWFWGQREESLGIPRVEALNPFFVFPDPAFKLREHWKHRYIAKSYWEDYNYIVMKWPEKRDEINAIARDYKANKRWWRGVTDFFQSLKGGRAELDVELIDQQENMFRLIELHERKPKKEYKIYNLGTGESSDPMSKAQAMALQNQFTDVQMVEHETNEIWTTITLGRWLVLDQFKRKIQNNVFPIVPIEAYNFSGMNFGMIGQAKDMQAEYNQTRTAILTLLHTTAASGWKYMKGSLDPEMKQHLEKFGASAGLNIEYNPSFPPPDKIQPNPFPQGEAERAEYARRDIDDITSFGPGQLGQREEQAESGILNAQRTQNALVTLRPLIRNLHEAHQTIGQCQLDLMAEHLQSGRAIPIVGEENAESDVFQYNGSIAFKRFNIKLVKGQQSETQRLQKLLEWREVMQFVAGVGIDNPLLPFFIDSLDWPDKDKVLQAIMPDPDALPPQMQVELADGIQRIQAGMMPASNLLPSGQEEEVAA